MKIFKSFSDLGDQVQGLVSRVTSIFSTASSNGVKGVIADLLDVNTEGYIRQIDTEIGLMVLRFTMEGDQEAVDVLVRFRNRAIAMLNEMDLMLQLMARLDSAQGTEQPRAIREIADFLDSREALAAPPSEERDIADERRRLARIAGTIEEYLNGSDNGTAAPPIADGSLEEAVEGLARVRIVKGNSPAKEGR